MDFERREKENADRLENQVHRHIHTLQNLRQKLEARHDLKQRTEEYRTWQRDFLPKKHAVMIGKTLAEIETKSSQNSPSRQPTEDDLIDAEMNPELIQKHMYGDKRTKEKAKGAEELNNVLTSLHKLSELEKRISMLEKDNQYDQLLTMESPTANQRTMIEFRKKRTPIKESVTTGKIGGAGTGGRVPVGMVFEVRNKKAGAPGAMAGSGTGGNKAGAAAKQWKVASGAGIMAVKAKRSNQVTDDMDGYDGEEYEEDEEEEYCGRTGGKNVFITAQTSEDHIMTERELKKKERMRQQALAPAGVKSLKNRVQVRQGRAKEEMIGKKKHEEAMKEMARRKAEAKNQKAALQSAPQKGARGGKGGFAAPKKGIAAGVHSKNPHLQEFQQMKRGFQKRKGKLHFLTYFSFIVMLMMLLSPCVLL